MQFFEKIDTQSVHVCSPWPAYKLHTKTINKDYSIDNLILIVVLKIQFLISKLLCSSQDEIIAKRATPPMYVQRKLLIKLAYSDCLTYTSYLHMEFFIAFFSTLFHKMNLYILGICNVIWNLLIYVILNVNLMLSFWIHLWKNINGVVQVSHTIGDRGTGTR